MTTEAPAPVTTALGTERLAWEEWARRKRTPQIDTDAAAALHGWAVGRPLTESQYDAAISAARNLVFR